MNSTNFSTRICDCRAQLMQSALQFTRNNDDADDLVHDTLLKAIRYESKFEEDSNLKGWLFTIMKNTFINNYKSLGRRSVVFIRNIDPWLYPITESTSVNQGEAKMVSEDISKALENLQPAYAIPFVIYFQGYRYHEIAEQMNIPIGTHLSRYQMFFARTILQG
ncbi:RNA polymerase sigma factor [Pedobacter heparinus]|uniref:RNA polymerase sigma factor n=1 Tax=Pedobacter heparinus TaxID=984 RepID=UPI00292FE561|nr:RNA polymerase sigma factor [Pedobacter heparinus]